MSRKLVLKNKKVLTLYINKKLINYDDGRREQKMGMVNLAFIELKGEGEIR